MSAELRRCHDCRHAFAAPPLVVANGNGAVWLFCTYLCRRAWFDRWSLSAEARR